MRRALLWFLEHGLEPPTRVNGGPVAWRRPHYATLRAFIDDPAHGGAYACGRTGVSVTYDGAVAKARPRRKPREEWPAREPGAHEGCVDRDRADPRAGAIRTMVGDDVPAAGARGATKHGSALLAGILRCRRELPEADRPAHRRQARHPAAHACLRGRLDHGEPKCIACGGLRACDVVEAALMAVVQPAAIQAARDAEAQVAARRDEAREALGRELEAARYAADRAFCQHDAADPENRFVAGELEARVVSRPRARRRRPAAHRRARRRRGAADDGRACPLRCPRGGPAGRVGGADHRRPASARGSCAPSSTRRSPISTRRPRRSCSRSTGRAAPTTPHRLPRRRRGQRGQHARRLSNGTEEGPLIGVE